MNWFRLYHDLIDDPKVQRLDAVAFKVWINLLCLASRSEPRGRLPSMEDMAFALRITEEELAEILELLQHRGLLEVVDGVLFPHNWDGRQFRSDDVASRVRRSRTKFVEEEVEAKSAAVVTPIKTDTKPVTKRSVRQGGKTAVSDDFTVRGELLDYAESLGFYGNDVEDQLARFLDYHRAKGSRFSDWGAAWRNWCRNARRFADERTTPKAGQRRMTDDEYWAKVESLVSGEG